MSNQSFQSSILSGKEKMSVYFHTQSIIYRNWVLPPKTSTKSIVSRPVVFSPPDDRSVTLRNVLSLHFSFVLEACASPSLVTPLEAKSSGLIGDKARKSKQKKIVHWLPQGTLVCKGLPWNLRLAFGSRNWRNRATLQGASMLHRTFFRLMRKHNMVTIKWQHLQVTAWEYLGMMKISTYHICGSA